MLRRSVEIAHHNATVDMFETASNYLGGYKALSCPSKNLALLPNKARI